MRAFLAALVLALSGCASPSFPLGVEWAPLEEVKQDPTGLQSASLVTTLGTVVIVPSLTAWEADYPAGSLARSALLTHEREHSRRQLVAGIGWFARYLTESSFRWDEERIGWRLEIQAHVTAGERVDAGKIGKFLAENYMGMVDEQTATAWVRSVVSGGD